MRQVLAPSEKSLAFEGSNRILCAYINATSQIQIIRIKNIPKLHLERVVFPGQRLIFEAVSEANLEISSGDISSICIPCQELLVAEIS
jgi:hypothetical protein